MAVPIVGKYIVLPVLLLLFYVCYGFRIRELGQAGSVDHSACSLDPNKCPNVNSATDKATTTTASLRRNQLDTGGVGGGGGHIKFGTGSIQKAAGDFKESKRDKVKEVKMFGYGNVRLKTAIEMPSIIDERNGNISNDEDDEEDRNDDRNDDDDDDDDVIIEDEDEDNDHTGKADSGNDEEDIDDEEGRNSDEMKLGKFDKISKSESKWNLKSGKQKLISRGTEDGQKKDNDNNPNTKRRLMPERIDEKRVSKRPDDRDKRTKREKMQLREEAENSENESKDDEFEDMEHADNKIDIDSNNGNKDVNNNAHERRNQAGTRNGILINTDASDEKYDTVSPEKNLLFKRNLEKVRLANKDGVKPIELSHERQTLKSNSTILSTEEIEADDDKKNVTKGIQVKKKLEVEKHVGIVVESTVKDTKKITKKKPDVMSEGVKDKTAKPSKAKPVDRENKNNISGVTKKSSTIKDQAETSISLNKLNDEILRLPNFVPNFTATTNSVCQHHGKIFLRQFRGYKLWAFQMLDSSAKIPSGLLRGNVNQLGDYDQCLGISARVKVDKKTVKVQGKYCLANIDIYASLPDMKVPVNLMQSRNFLRGTMYDTAHFVPKFTTINWALCLPAACSATDAQIAMSSALGYLNNTSGLKFIVDVNPNMCYVRQRTQNYSKETIGVLYFYAMICCLVFVATLRDFLVNTEEKSSYSERIIMSFSMRRTLRILMKPAQVDSDDINCIHGIRSLATIVLYIAHKMIPIAGLPYSNRIVLTEVSNNPLSCLLRVSIVYTDSFLILSGVLSAFNLSKESETRGEIRWFCRFVARFIRLTPALLVIIFWYAYIMEHLGSGPQWNIMKENADLCKLNSWTNLLYIQNFFPFEEMCATHTHQLALDMQLSLFAPGLVYILQVKPVIGILLMFFLLQVSATIRYFVTTNNYLSIVIFHGMTAKHLYKTANLTYAVSIHRITPYLFGIGLGVLMYRSGKNVKIHRIFTIFGWIVALLLGLWSIFSPWAMAKRDYVYDPEGNAQYAVLGPVSWALALCWVIFACFTNHAGIVNKFLSSYWLLVFSRISYSVYLTQFAVFFYNLATTRYSSEFQVHRVIDFYEIVTVIIISTILTLFFDIPMQGVKSVLMDCTDANAIKIVDNKSEADNNEESKPSINNEHCQDEDFDKLHNKKDGSQATSMVSDYYDEKPDVKSWKGAGEPGREYETGIRERKRSKSVQKTYVDNDVVLRRDITPNRYQDDNQRNRRARSKPSDVHLKQSTNHDEFRISKRDRSEERRRERFGKLSQKTPVSMISSGSEDELLQRRVINPRHPIERPRVSDEEDWEQELRIRRRRFMERMAREVRDSKSEKENSQDVIMRRSSAEGKIALLTGTTECRGMDAWTVSRGPRISIVGGSSQEQSDTEEDSCLTCEYEQSEEECKVNIPQRLNVTEEDDRYELELENANNTKMIMDLRQSSQEEISPEKARHLSANEVTPVITGKLFKRESIVKSQASEEDPEYLLPERPKLVEQEQEHPFRKAWQMQKSRSEEDGPSAFTIRDVKPHQNEPSTLEKKSSPPPISRGKTQTFQLVVEDVDLDSQQIDRDEDDRVELVHDIDGEKHNTDDEQSVVCFSDIAEPSKVDHSGDEEELSKVESDHQNSETSDQDNGAL